MDNSLPQANQYTVANVDASILNRREQIDFNKFTQDMEKVINDLDMFLAGYRIEKDAQTGNWLKTQIAGRPMMNEHGREYVKSRLKTYLNPNLYLSSLSDKDATKSFQLDIVNFSCELYGNLTNYAMKLNDAEKTVGIVAPVIWFALRKSQSDKAAIYEGMRSTNTAQQQPFNPLGALSPQPQQMR